MAPRLTAPLLLAGGAAGHGVLTLPHGRQGGILAGGGLSGQNGWYTDDTSPKGLPTNCAREMRTVRGCQSPIHMGRDPWGSPGAAGVLNACGGAKSPPGEAPCKGCTEPFAAGSGSELPKKKVDVWKQGAQVKVAWGIAINHGGGYSYRLCPATETPTEACFQQHHLQFVDETSIIHWGNGTELTIPSRTVSTGTVPAGSTWKRNPIPLGGPGVGHGSPIMGFKPPCTGCNGDQNKFSIVDLVQIPAGIATGDYLISWRWDTEETPQVWVNCGDVTIVAGDAPGPAPAPAPAPPAADSYGCVNSECVAQPGGVPRATCAAVCQQ